MTSNYTREQLKLCVAKMCLSIGWHTTMTTPIELLTDILCNYLAQLGKLTSDYANGFGLNEAIIDHLVLALKDFHVYVPDLTEFVKNVDSPEPPLVVPQYPIRREDHLNFLKPGSKEVVTRHVHVHEHLPPMFPHLEEANTGNESPRTELGDQENAAESTDPIFKRPAEVSPDIFKRPRILTDEEAGRPTREISSVIMTTSGFLSPAREGRLPEARAPVIALEPAVPMLPPGPPDVVKKLSKNIKKSDKLKDNTGRDIFKPYKDLPFNKHLPPQKNVMHSKKHRVVNNLPPSPVPSKNYMVVNEPKINAFPQKKLTPENDSQIKFNKTLAAARMKTEKFNTTITPILPRSIPATIVRPEPLVDKLFTEPDKKKVNILKKISVKTDKSDRGDKINKIKEESRIESRESSPDLIIDESMNSLNSSHQHFSKDITIELVSKPPLASPLTETTSIKKSPEKPDKFERSYFDDYSPPGTPSTPRTPEMVSHSPPTNKSEKSKPKSKHRKIHKYSSPSGLDIDMIDVELERPKTPDSNIVMRPEKRRHPSIPPMHFPFYAPLSGPGLIPTPLTNSLFPHLPIPPMGLSNFSQPPYLPAMHPQMPINFMPPVQASLPSPSTVCNPTFPKAVPTSAPKPALTPPSPPASTPTVIKTEENNDQPNISGTPDKNESLSFKLDDDNNTPSTSNADIRHKEHKRDKKDKLKKKNKKDKHKSDKKKLKEEKKEKARLKKEKKEKKRNKEAQNDSTSPVPKITLKLPPKKLNIKAIVKHEEPIEPQPVIPNPPEYVPPREMSPELARFSALVTGQPKQRNPTPVSSVSTSIDTFPTSSTDSINTKKSITPKVRTRELPVAPTYVVDPSASCYIDSDGKKVWICPGCGVQDDGSPMIGCDGCDAWYHWVCVGIQVPPDDNEDWYCRHCIDRNRDLLKRERRKKRKGKDRRGHRH